jgi:hypothetical protein
MPDIVNALTGHRRKTVADSYGETPIETLNRKLSKIAPVGFGRPKGVRSELGDTFALQIAAAHHDESRFPEGPNTRLLTRDEEPRETGRLRRLRVRRLILTD